MSADYLCFTSLGGYYSGIGYTNYGSNEPDIQYSYDGEVWKPFLPEDQISLPNAGDKVYIRGFNPDGFSHDPYDLYNQYNDRRNCTLFYTTGLFNASGNVMSLIDGEGLTTTIPCDYCFTYLFSHCNLLTAPELPATTLTKYCYEGMFAYTPKLKYAPVLPATELTEGCYRSMFESNSLYMAPELPATVMKDRCYQSMFAGCDSMWKAPELPAVELAEKCYERMFMSCKSLVNPPVLPATKMKKGCYAGMFDACEALNQAPELPAMELADSCYADMFRFCHSLYRAPELPATTLAKNCYSYMFFFCKNLAQAPELPATELAEGCYQYMFELCYSLVTAPKLPATALVRNCYRRMFKTCEKLNYIEVGVMSLDNEVDATLDWVDEVFGSGTFVFPCGSRYETHGPSQVPGGFKILGSPVIIFQNPDSSVLYADTLDCGATPVYRGVFPPSAGEGSVFLHWDKELTVLDSPGLYYVTAKYENESDPPSPECLCLKPVDGVATFSIVNVGGNKPNIEYSKNGGVTWEPLEPGVTISLDASVGNRAYIRGINPEGFSKQENVYTQFKTTGEIAVSGSVMSLVDGEGTSTVIPNAYCFTRLFSNTTITSAPKLPAVSLKESCYDHMFAGCEDLAKLPALPATKMYPSCYRSMFSGCYLLDSIKSLPATEMAPYCYAGMFRDCDGLVCLPKELPATEMAEGCYQSMFYGCAAVWTSPELPAMKLSKYCYDSMYYGCSFLSNVGTLPAVTLQDYCYSSMFENCTNIVYSGKMMADKLAEGCCRSMFKGCSALRDVYLPGSAFEKECYREMFVGCSWLTYIRVDMYTLDNDVDATLNWVDGVDSEGLFVFLCGSRYDKHGVSEVPDNFTIKASPIIIFQTPDSTVLQRDTIDCETKPAYRGVKPTCGGDSVFVGWDKPMEIPYSADTYYYTAVFGKKGDVTGPWLRFVAEVDGSSIWYENHGENQPDVKYSIDDGDTWISLKAGDHVALDSGQSVYFKGNNPNGFSHGGASNNTTFGMSGRLSGSGDVMSLIAEENIYVSIPCAHCFDSLFAGCEALVTAPNISSTLLREACYKNMFTHCTNLKEVPQQQLLSSIVEAQSYYGMYSYCESLTNAPELRASMLNVECYAHMFEGCISLEEAPTLPSSSPDYGCYYAMFKGCTNLKRAPLLGARSLVDHCYAHMFQGCSNLEYIEVSIKSLDNDVDATEEWVEGVDGPGLFVFPCGSKYDKHGVSEVPDNFAIKSSPIIVFLNSDGTELWRDTIDCATKPKYRGETPSVEGLQFIGWDRSLEPISEPGVYYFTAQYLDLTNVDMSRMLCFTAEEDASEIWYTIRGSGNPDIQYSVDEGETWKNLGYEEKLVLPKAGDKAYFRGFNLGGFSLGQPVNGEAYLNFCMSGKIAASGSVMSLLDGTGQSTVIPKKRCFYMLFFGCKALTQAPELPATTLDDYCYQNMFSGCENLTNAPVLPATEVSVSCYSSMFRNCSSLTAAPVLPAKEMKSYCYYDMFSGCSSLTTAPELPAMELSEYCYSNMFSGCSSLTTAPELPAMNLGDNCYSGMFYNCSSLTTAPELPATKLTHECYSNMFGFTGITAAPVLRATTMEFGCYKGMFYRCMNLTKAPNLPAMELAVGCYTAMFDACQNLTEPPVLPATELAPYCYQEMFAGCTSMTKAPELPATKFRRSCYEGMFKYCFALEYIKVGVMTLDNDSSATAEWMEMVDGPGTFIFPCGSKYNKHGISEVPKDFKIVSSPIVIFQNPGGAEIWRDTIDCKTAPVYKGEEPSIGDGFTFVGWDNELTVLPIPDVYYYTAVYEEKEPLSVFDSTIAACDSIIFEGVTYRESASLKDTLTTAEGVDYVIVYHLTVHKGVTVDTSIMATKSFTWQGVTYTENASWSDTLQTVNGCDSIVNVNLIINGDAPIPVTDTTIAACDSYVHKGITYSENSVWNDTLTTASGADSIITYHLTIHKSTLLDTTITAMESVTWQGTTYTESISWIDTLQTVAGCDSIVRVNLVVKTVAPPPITVDKVIFACDSFVFKNSTYRENNSWNEVLKTADGGDSIVSYRLTIHKSVTVDTTITAEGSFTWKGVTYTKDASWSDTLQTVNGCDSIVRYKLVVNEEKSPLQLTVEDDLYLVLPGGSETISYELTGGEGSTYEVRYKDKTLCKGDVTNDSTVSLTCPKELEPGAYTATLTMYDGEGEKAEKNFTFNVMLPDNKQKSYYVKVWNDVVICRNGEEQFLTFQWYKAGEKCENASLQYFNDLSSLNGEYMVYVSDKTGKSYFIEPVTYAPVEASYTITAEPNVVARNADFTVKVSGVSEDDLQWARIAVYRANGVIERVIDEVRTEHLLNLRSGEYVIVLTVKDGKNANCKVLVK